VVYAVLFVLGAFEGIVGSFHYSQPPAPWIAVLLVLALFTSCLLAAVGTESFRGMVMVAIGWAIAAFLLSMGSHAGSVIITATTAGEVFLYGGTLAVGLAALATYVWQTRSRLARAGQRR